MDSRALLASFGFVHEQIKMQIVIKSIFNLLQSSATLFINPRNISWGMIKVPNEL
jgi:hypothetical protein